MYKLPEEVTQMQMVPSPDALSALSACTYSPAEFPTIS